MGNSSATETEIELSQRCDVFTPPICIDQGTMMKQPVSFSAVVDPKRWKERYFILKRGGLYYYSIGRTEVELVLGEVENVEYGDLTPTISGHSGYKLLIREENGILITLAATSKQGGNVWLSAIKGTGERKRGLMYYLSYPNTRWECWVIRNVIIEENVLVVREVSLLGYFPLSNAKVEPCATNFLTFHVMDQEEGRVLTLLCESEAECNNWATSIEKMCSTGTERALTSSINVLDFYNVLKDVVDHGHAIQNTIWKTRNANDTFFVLSIDGGGTRGIIPCVILERLFEEFPDFLSKVDYVTGTSNGSMISMALAFGYHPRTIKETMEVTARAMFSEQQARYSVSTPRWSNRFMSVFCKEIWQDHTMKDASIPACMVPAFLLDNEDVDEAKRKMEIATFTSYNNLQETLVRDVVMRSCAAPIYFPAYQKYVDGGIFAHNPADLAIADIVSSLGIPLEKVVLLSLGTGRAPQYFPADGSNNDDTHNYGYYQWLPKLPGTIWAGMIDKSNLLCQNLLGDRFHRVDVALKEDFSLDEPELLPQLSTYGKDEDLTNVTNWIKWYIYDKK